METTCIYEPLKELHASNRNKASFAWNYSSAENSCRHFGAPKLFIWKKETLAAESMTAKVSFDKQKKLCTAS